MTEFNPVHLKQDIGIPGASEKLQEGKTGLPVRRQTGKEPEQMMPFACVMGNACRATTQNTEKIPLNFRSDKGKIDGRSNKGNAIRRGGVFNIDPENNILSAGKGKTEKTNQSLNNILGAGKDKTEKTNQSLPVKGKGIAESSHGAILKHEATKDINPFMNASKGKGTKTNRSFSGKIDLLSKRNSQKQTREKVENLQGSNGLKKSKAGINHALMGDAKGLLKPGLNKQSIESGLTKSGLIRVGTDALIGPFGERALHSGMRTGKIAVAVFRDGGFRESVAGINNALVRGQKPEAGGKRLEIRGQRAEGRGQRAEGKGQRAKIEDAPGVLRSGLKKAAVAKGKSAVEPGQTKKNPFTLTKNDSGKNEIKDILRHSGLKSGEAIEILHRKISSPSHSPSHSPLHSIDKISSGGAYHHITFHSGGSSAVINESVKSHGIEPRALINQIASGVKRPGRVRITLNPPSLGTLDMDVLVRDNKVHVILQAENNDVRQILQSNVESLKSSLRNHGLVADTINVSVQEKSDGADYGANYKSGQNETLFKEGGKREGNEEDHGEGRDSLNHNLSSFEEENPGIRSDGRISLFV